MLAKRIRSRNAWLLPALMAAALAVAAPTYAIPPDPNPLPGDNFQGGDGDQDAPDPANGQVDWQNAAGTAEYPDPNADDNIFFAGNKEITPGAWTFGTQNDGASPPKDNVFVFWSNPSVTSGDQFLRLAFQREHPPGNTYLTFELNKAAGTWENGAGSTIPCRTDGDLLISYEVTPSGDPVTIRVYVWDGEGGPAECPDGDHGTLTDNLGPLNNPLAEAAVNFHADIPNYLNPAEYGNTFAAGQFGEASLNLSGILKAAGVPAGDVCANQFQQIHMHSRSSVAIDSDLQDYVAPVPTGVEPCSPPPPPPPPPPPAETPPPPPAAAPLPDLGGALPETVSSLRGSARLAAPAGCVGRTFSVRVRGSRIARVDFYVDGKRVAVDRRASFVTRINSRRYSAGAHRITAKVRFRAGVRPRSRTLHSRFLRCARRAQVPQFTG